MKKNRLKNSLTMIVLGVLIGLLITAITTQLTMTYIFMFIALLVLLIIGISIITTDDLDIRILKAYERGVNCATALHCNCRHSFSPKRNIIINSSFEDKSEG